MKLSIALTTYNGARYLAEQLASFARQSRPPDEVVVCDERSGDATPAILEEFRASAPFPVRVVINDERLGIIANFEKAIGLCTGDIIFLADQDDSWHPDKLARHEAVYRDDPEVGLVFSDAAVVDGDLKPLGLRMYQQLGVTPERLGQLNGPGAFRLLVRRPCLLGCTISFRADLRRYLHPFPTNQLHDNWIPFALATVCRFRGIAEPLIDYRSHAQQSVGVNDLRDAKPGPAARTPDEEVDHQEDLLATIERHVAGFRDRVRVRDFDRILAAKRAFLRRRRWMVGKPFPLRALVVGRELLTGTYFRYATYARDELRRDLRGRR